MTGPTLRQSAPAVDATAVVVDLRNFTPNLQAAHVDEAGVNPFCTFLAGLYGLCLDAALAAIPLADRAQPPLNLGSTGDGVIMIFLDPTWHFAQAYLSALTLQGILGGLCEGYNRTDRHPRVPLTGFGIGVESGSVFRVSARRTPTPIVDTYIGDCINVASRAQGVSKHLHNAPVILCRHVNQLLTDALLDEDYGAILDAAWASQGDAAYLSHLEHLSHLNHELCLGFLHLHRLRGVDRPMSLFRVSKRAAVIGNPRFDRLVRRLVRGDEAHAEAVLSLLAR